MTRLSSDLESKLLEICSALVDQESAKVIVPANEPKSGFWFGGGNLVVGPDRALYVVGRYRNVGDSRTGVGAGERGLELAILRSTDGGETFKKTVSFSKSDLNVADHNVLSIEGSALHISDKGVELFVSTEKTNIEYPRELNSFLKPGTGVWTIDRLSAGSIEGLKSAAIEPVMQFADPRFIHVKDPAVWTRDDGSTVLLFCTHPFCWSSSNSAYSIQRPHEESFDWPRCDFLSRGQTWDVAITRATAIVDVPQVGAFADLNVSLLFYDGGESLRNLDEHASAVSRPRGYSCEELGGVGYFVSGNLDQVQRLSVNLPTFVSPWGTGSSRYVDVLSTDDGMFATWQQSQRDLSQPLVMNVVDRGSIEQLLR